MIRVNFSDKDHNYISKVVREQVTVFGTVKVRIIIEGEAVIRKTVFQINLLDHEIHIDIAEKISEIRMKDRIDDPLIGVAPPINRI